jgi:nucleotide-binding universal stress UspA family protein
VIVVVLAGGFTYAPPMHGAGLVLAVRDEVLAYVENERSRAAGRLEAYLAEIGLEADTRLAELAEVATAETIDDCARELKADLIVIGTQARSSIARFVLGSVAQGVLRAATSDVLVVPPREAA